MWSSTLTDEYYRVTLAEDGSLAELLDKSAGRDLIDHSAPFRFLGIAGISPAAARQNAFGLAREPHEPLSQPPGKILAGENGPAAASLVVLCPGWPQSRTEITLAKGVRRIDFRLELTPEAFKVTRGKPRPVWLLALPLALAPASLRLGLDTPSGYLDPWRDRIPGSYNGPMLAVHGLTASDGSLRVDLGSAETYIWDLPNANGNIAIAGGAGKGVERPRFATFLSRLSGQRQLSFTMTSEAAGAVSPEASAPFLGTVNNDLLATVVKPGTGGAGLPPSASVFRLDRGNVELLAFKRAEQGTGYVVRMRELSGQAGAVVLSSDLFDILSAARVNLVEEAAPDSRVSVEAGRATFAVRAYETVALRIGRLGRKAHGR